MRKLSLEDLHHDLDETQGIINILERASRELSTIIDWDEGLRKNPLRHRQLASIGEQLAIARGKQTSVARTIERLESRPSGEGELLPFPRQLTRRSRTQLASFA